MRAALRSKLEQQLIERRRDLAKSYNRSQATNRRSDDGPLDLADTASELYTQEFNYSLSEKDRDELTLISQALDRIEAGEFGECDDCGEKIAEARLKAIPWAPRCIQCQELVEARASRVE